MVDAADEAAGGADEAKIQAGEEPGVRPNEGAGASMPEAVVDDTPEAATANARRTLCSFCKI